MEKQGEKRDRDPEETRTPTWIREFVNKDFKITFEPQEALKEPLKGDWKGFSFAHPPADNAEGWCAKAVEEAKKGHFSVLLMPAVFSSIYWRNLVYPNATEIRVLACPIRMNGAKKQTVSQMCLLVFAGTENRDEEYPEYPPVFPVEPENWQEHYYKRARNKIRFG